MLHKQLTWQELRIKAPTLTGWRLHHRKRGVPLENGRIEEIRMHQLCSGLTFEIVVRVEMDLVIIFYLESYEIRNYPIEESPERLTLIDFRNGEEFILERPEYGSPMFSGEIVYLSA